MNQVIQLDGILSFVQNDEIQVYSSNTISSLVEFYSESIKPTIVFGIPLAYINVVQTIQLNSVLELVANDAIQLYSSNTILEISDSFSSSIVSQNQFNDEFIHFISVSPSSIESAELVGNVSVIQTIVVESIQSTVQFGDEKKISMQIVDVDEIVSQVLFGNSKLNFKVFANSTIVENVFGESKVNSRIFANAVNPSALFGNLQTNMSIEDVPFPSIESTAIVSTPNVLKVIGPLGIASTASFGVASFIDNIHRILIFKDDNISKVGENDATVIAGGIRLNPASVVSETASEGNANLPINPAGFLSVNIAGIDYKIPYYNS